MDPNTITLTPDQVEAITPVRHAMMAARDHLAECVLREMHAESMRRETGMAVAKATEALRQVITEKVKEQGVDLDDPTQGHWDLDLDSYTLRRRA